jgi:poly(3-hydroxyoctanoate) depolymerase
LRRSPSDVPGIGESALPWHPYRLWMVALLTSRLLTNLGYKQVDVLGFSWGGTLAQQFAFQNPIRCRRLILAATLQGLPMSPPPRFFVLRKFLTPRRFNDPGYREKIAGKIYGGAARTRPDFIRELGSRIKRTSRRGSLLQQLALLSWISVPWLPWLSQPTLILAGDDDPVIPLANAHLMAGLIPSSRLHIFHDGHHFLLSSVDEASRVVREFLNAEAGTDYGPA